MSFSAVQAGYTGETYRYTQTKTQTQAVRGSSFDRVVKCTEEQNSNQVIGQTSVFFKEEGMRYEMQAQYAPHSTADDPIVRVNVKEGNEWVSYDVKVFEVDPQNASQLEIFALMSYADDQDISRTGSKGSYQQLRMFADNAQQNGYWEGNGSFKDFVGNKQNWTHMMRQMCNDYSDSGIYSQSTSCSKVHFTLQWFELRTMDISQFELVNMSEKAFSSYSFPSLPDGVFKAFLETDVAMGDRMPREMSTQLINHFFGQVQMMQKETGGECTLEMVIQIVKDALAGLDYPLTPELKQSKELKEELDMLRSFYESFLNKLETLKEDGVEKVEHEELEEEDEEFDAWESFMKILEQIYQSVLRGENEPSYRIGAQSFTEKEWDRFLEKFDILEEEIRRLVKERIEKQNEKAQEQQEYDEKVSEEMIDLLFEDRDKRDE